MSDFKIVIPARYGSSRLPGKPLIDLAGKPMVQHVYEQALKAGASEIIVATDDDRIRDKALSFGAEAVMTDIGHENGTERIAEVAAIKGWSRDDVVVNLQGDEPLISKDLICATANGLVNHPNAGISSLCSLIDQAEDLFDPNTVKVILDDEAFALYFSRAPIPWDRDKYKHGNSQLSSVAPAYRHIGMYAYRVSFLHDYGNMLPTALERAESLEQLRALSYGVKIHMTVIEQQPGHGVDTPADVDRVSKELMNL